MASLYKRIQTTIHGSQVSAAPGTVERVQVNSHSTGTFRLIDSTTHDGLTNAAGVMGTFTPATGSGTYEVNAVFTTGIFLATSNAVDITVFYNGDPLR